MGPRKRPKPNPEVEDHLCEGSQFVAIAGRESALNSKGDGNASEGTQSDASAAPLPGDLESSAMLEAPGKRSASRQYLDSKVQNKPRNEESRSAKSWYGGTWPRVPKAAPVTQIAKESISAASNVASELVYNQRSPSGSLKNPSLYLTRSSGSSSRSLPLAATMTKVNVTSSTPSSPNGVTPEQAMPAERAAENDEKQSRALSLDDNEAAKPDLDGQKPKPKEGPLDRPIDEAAGWRGWFTRSDGQNITATPILQRSTPLNVEDERREESPKNSTEQRSNSDPNLLVTTTQQEQQARSWLGLWGNASINAGKNLAPTATNQVRPSDPTVNINSHLPEHQSSNPNPATPALSTSQSNQNVIDKPPGWTFWSRASAQIKGDSKSAESSVGKLAVADSSTQSQSRSAVVDAVKEVSSVTGKVGKRERPNSIEDNDDTKLLRVPLTSGSKIPASSSAFTSSEAKLLETGGATPASKPPPNLLLPSICQTYRAPEPPSILQQIGRLLNYNSLLEPKHVRLLRDPPQLKRALAIGVHGYFPAPLIRTVLGQPTGTSIRFANSAADAIQRWTQEHGYSCEIEKVALEGEGKIAERIELLWKLMLNWIENIRQADFVMFACHSQGVPVTMMLVAKLIAFGCVNEARIGVCAMAGVNLGPFPDYKSRWIGGSAGELFEFAKPESIVSKDYVVSLELALRFGVRIVYIGSIDDQLVSLESSTFGTIDHPNIYRAVFIDGRVHAPDFLVHLVGFALKLRNLGVSDHGLIRELSTPLAGSLYGGEGHSRIYNDEEVYHLAVSYALETSSIGEAAFQIHRETNITSQNPYILPFAMRGVLEEDYVRTELHKETNELLKQFDEWKPASKALKDVKFRLEGIRSRL